MTTPETGTGQHQKAPVEPEFDVTRWGKRIEASEAILTNGERARDADDGQWHIVAEKIVEGEVGLLLRLARPEKPAGTGTVYRLRFENYPRTNNSYGLLTYSMERGICETGGAMVQQLSMFEPHKAAQLQQENLDLFLGYMLQKDSADS